MSRHARYPVDRKVEAVRRVIEDGLSVDSVALELGIRRGALFFWVRRYRQITQHKAGYPDAMQAVLPHAANEPSHRCGSLVAWLRRLPHATDMQAAKSGKAKQQDACLVSIRP